MSYVNQIGPLLLPSGRHHAPPRLEGVHGVSSLTIQLTKYAAITSFVDIVPGFPSNSFGAIRLYLFTAGTRACLSASRRCISMFRRSKVFSIMHQLLEAAGRQLEKCSLIGTSSRPRQVVTIPGGSFTLLQVKGITQSTNTMRRGRTIRSPAVDKPYSLVSGSSSELSLRSKSAGCDASRCIFAYFLSRTPVYCRIDS